MKNKIIIISLFSLTIFNSCSSGDDVYTSNTETNVKNTFPAELIGDWKINYVTLAKDPDYNWGNSFGAYIKFNSDNTIEYKDGNTFGGVNSVNKVKTKNVYGKISDLLSINIGGIPASISCYKSGAHPNQIEFKILYPSNSSFKDIILVGTKK